MIVVADTSPLNYLIQIDCDELLPQLYGRILIPAAVKQELGHRSAPLSVHAWLGRIPNWVDIAVPSSSFEPELAFLDLGEREAIQLAEERHAELLLLDERKGALKRSGVACAPRGRWGSCSVREN